MPEQASKAIDQPWVDVKRLAPKVSRNQLVACLLNELLPILDSFQERGFAHYHQEWESMHAYQGCEVEISNPRGSTIGCSLGVDAAGALRVKVDGEERCFHGGEVSLRPL